MAGEIGHVGAANTIALGCIAAATGVVAADSLARVIRRRFSGKICDVNLEALHQGARLAACLILPPHGDPQPPPGQAAPSEKAL
jgi:Pyruvate/2-oxoacid:ferredoxin oxidoreductase gamma subunit